MPRISWIFWETVAPRGFPKTLLFVVVVAANPHLCGGAQSRRQESDERVVLLLGEDRHEVAAQGVATVLLRGVPAEAVGHEDVLGYNKKQ